MNMRKALYRFMAIILACMMIISAVSVSAFAAQQNTVRKSLKHYKIYTALGDSIACGYGLNGGEHPDGLNNQLTITHGQLVDGSYPVLVGKAVGADIVYNPSRVAYTVSSFLRLLDPSYEHELNQPKNYWERFQSQANYFQAEVWGPGDYAYQKSAVKSQVESADLITINLGSNEISTNSLWSSVYKALYYGGGMTAQAAFAMADHDFQTAESLDDLIRMVNRGESDRLNITTILSEIEINTKIYERNFDRLVKVIHQLNPDAEIYALGIYNPFAQAEPQGSALQTALSNQSNEIGNSVADYMKNKSSARTLYTYVDVHEAECWPSKPMYDPGYLIHFLVHCHPDFNGHRYMANQIIDAINANARK